MGEWLLSRRDGLIVARHEYLFSVILNPFSSSAVFLVVQAKFPPIAPYLFFIVLVLVLVLVIDFPLVGRSSA